MINVYTTLRLDGFELCQPEDPNDYERITVLVDGEPRQAFWTPLSMKMIHKDRRKKLLPSDSPWLSSQALLFKPAAIRAMRSILCEYGELLPVICKDEEVYLFNPTRVIDALDETASSIDRFSNGRIMHISEYVFLPERIRGVDIFKLPMRASETYVQQRFVDIWNAAGLKGLEFKRVWTAEGS